MKAQNGYTGRKVVKNVALYNAHGEIEKHTTPVTLYERTIEFRNGSLLNTLLNLSIWPIVAGFIWAIIKLMGM